jgi:hypothetical protein
MVKPPNPRKLRSGQWIEPRGIAALAPGADAILTISLVKSNPPVELSTTSIRVGEEYEKNR